MMETAAWQLLPDGRRLHLTHGPIDIILEANGTPAAVAAAHASAVARFRTVLQELCAELTLLRTPANLLPHLPAGAVARRMCAAVLPHCQRAFITPMAAVAGSVADEVLAAIAIEPGLRRLYVNNGGDIALYLAPAEHFALGIVDNPHAPRLAGTARITAASAVRGVATSGWRGRSFSLGIADAVTVLAASASAADAAATIIANAVDLPGHAAVVRAPASSRQPDSDLGERLVTIDVGRLDGREINAALRNGLDAAQRLLADGHIIAAALLLDGHARTAGRLDLALQPPAGRLAA
jgi:ApbE superfamily uncharacterized protein (UPF0280 family)